MKIYEYNHYFCPPDPSVRIWVRLALLLKVIQLLLTIKPIKTTNAYLKVMNEDLDINVIEKYY